MINEKENQGAAAPRTAKAVALLEATRAKLAKGWCRRAFACDADGNRVDPTSPKAISWCISGALIASGGEVGDDAYCCIERAIGRPLGINTWNDSADRQESEVLAIVDAAIALAAPAAPKEPQP